MNKNQQLIMDLEILKIELWKDLDAVDRVISIIKRTEYIENEIKTSSIQQSQELLPGSGSELHSAAGEGSEQL